MLTRPIPKSGEAMPVIGLGTSKVFDVGTGETERAPLQRVVQGLVAGGGRMLDSVADVRPRRGRRRRHRHGHRTARQALSRSKVWTTGHDAGVAQIEESFKRMKVDRIDLMQVHNLVDLKTQLATLRAMKAAGRVRYVGVSHWVASAHAELEQVMKDEDLDFVQLNYSIIEREAEARLLPLAIERKVAVIVNRPFARGGLFDRVKGKALPEWAASFGAATWGQFFLKFVISHPAVTCTIPATGKVEHLRDNIAAGFGPLPDPATREPDGRADRRLSPS
jgi:aryl-alcohol dehydrogenase-like predicted oxidoreductase